VNFAGPAVVVVLGVIAALHFYWGCGGTWPARSGAHLERLAVGTRKGRMPGFLPSVAVALLLGIAGYVVAAASQLAHRLGVPDVLWLLANIGVAGVFLLRGAATYAPGVFDYARGTPFHSLNRRYYGPLCLLLAAGVAVVLL